MVVPAGSEQAEQVDDFADLDLEQLLDVVFTASKHEQDIGQSPSAVTVITRADIEASGATTLSDLLRIVPGMEIVTVSHFFVSATLRLFWTYNNNHFLVLIDGREANIELLGFPPWEVQPISVEDVERIEIIRGPGSFLYGANAMAGVVTITTRPASQKSGAEVRLSAGESGTLTTSARASARLGNFGLVLSGGVDRALNPTDPRAATKDVWKIRAFAEYQLTESSRLVADAGYVDGSGPVSTGVGTISAGIDLALLRLAYESEDLKGQLYYTYSPTRATVNAPVQYNGLLLAEFLPIKGLAQVIDAELQWTLPTLHESLLFIVGGGGRASNWNSDQFIDGETYADQTSSGYHQVGIDHWEARAGAFLHAEYAPLDWLTLTGDLRFDYNTETEPFLSPRLALVVQPVKDQFLRLGVARAFRKPSFVEKGAHLNVSFPQGSIVQNQEGFREFMTKVVGNGELGNETLLAFEAGYLGRFLEGRLTVGLNVFYNILRNLVEFNPVFIPDSTGLMPDLERSSFLYDNRGPERDILGSELTVELRLSKSLWLSASWVQRIVLETRAEESRINSAASPKNLISLGGRFQLENGLVGSLYAFSRSEFWDVSMENPGGFLEPTLQMHLDDMLLVLGRLGIRIPLSDGFEVEAGLKLFLPVSPWRQPHFRAHEKGGTLTHAGSVYGGIELARMLTGYLHGTF